MKKYTLNEQIELNDSDIDIDKYVSMPPDYAGAIEDLAKSRKRKLQVQKELQKTADDFIKGKKVKVEESRRSKINEAKAQIEELDDDMWTFIYDLFTRGNRSHRPINPLDKKYRAFDYLSPEEDDVSGYAGVTTDVDGNIVLQSYNEDRFEDAREICDKYQIEYSDVKPLKSGKFYMTIKVPTDKNGDPIMAKKYFKSIGIDIENIRKGGFLEAVDLSKKEGTMSKVLQDNIESIYNTKSAFDVYRKVKYLFIENNIDTAASNRLLNNLDMYVKLHNKNQAIYTVLNSILAGSGNKVIKEEKEDKPIKYFAKKKINEDEEEKEFKPGIKGLKFI